MAVGTSRRADDAADAADTVAGAPGTRFARWARILARPGAQWAAAGAGLVGSVVVMVTALVVGPLPGNRPQTWWFALPDGFLRSHFGQVSSEYLFYLGMVLLVAAWLVVGIGVRAGGWRIRRLWLLAAVWVLPWFIAPVALTTDIYTYLGQGLVATSGLDPYTHGPGAVYLPDVLYTRIAYPVLDVPSPYGPIFVSFGKVFAPLAAEHVVRGILLLRLVELVGLVLAAISLPRVARAAGASPVTATWMGVASPVVLASGVLSGHNDLLMIGLLLAALALATRTHRFAMPLAIAVGTLAVLVKAPAAAGLLVIALTWVRRSPNVRTGAARVGIAVLVAAVVAALVSLTTGLGTQWLNPAAVASPSALSPPFTPVQAVGYALNSLGIGESGVSVFHALILPAEAIAALFALVVLWRSPRLGDARTIGLIFAGVVFLGPVVWPWYVIWPVMMFAAVRQHRGRFFWIALSSVALFVVRPDGAPHRFGLTGAWILAVLTVAALVIGARYAYRRLIMTPPQAPERPAVPPAAAQPSADAATP